MINLHHRNLFYIIEGSFGPLEPRSFTDWLRLLKSMREVEKRTIRTDFLSKFAWRTTAHEGKRLVLLRDYLYEKYKSYSVPEKYLGSEVYTKTCWGDVRGLFKGVLIGSYEVQHGDEHKKAVWEKHDDRSESSSYLSPYDQILVDIDTFGEPGHPMGVIKVVPKSKLKGVTKYGSPRSQACFMGDECGIAGLSCKNESCPHT